MFGTIEHLVELVIYLKEKLHHCIIKWILSLNQLVKGDSAHLRPLPLFVRLLRVLAGLEEGLGAVLLELVALALHLTSLLCVDVLGHPALVGRPTWAGNKDEFDIKQGG